MQKDLTVNQAAHRLGISRNTLFDLLHDGSLAGYKKRPGKLTSAWRIPAQSIEDFEKKRRSAQ
jgi:excisionase family DNA binding protein